jgi:hypothetical protein
MKAAIDVFVGLVVGVAVLGVAMYVVGKVVIALAGGSVD